MTRYLIPFIVGIILGIGTVPMWMASPPTAIRTPASLTVLPATTPLAHTHA